MNAKYHVLLAWTFLGIGAPLYSQEPDSIPLPDSRQTVQEDTEEAVLREKAEALEFQYKRFLAGEKAGAPFALPASVRRAGCDWHLASAELSAVRGQFQEQIRHLEQAVAFAEEVVEIQLRRQQAGTDDRVTEAIIHRADVKLALIRAKTQHKNR